MVQEWWPGLKWLVTHWLLHGWNEHGGGAVATPGKYKRTARVGGTALNWGVAAASRWGKQRRIMWLSDWVRLAWQVKRQAAWAATGGRGYNRRQRTGRSVAQGRKDRRCCFQQGQRGRKLGTDTYNSMHTCKLIRMVASAPGHGRALLMLALWLAAFRIAAIAGVWSVSGGGRKAHTLVAIVEHCRAGRVRTLPA